MPESIILCMLSIFSAIGIIYTLKYLFSRISERHTENPYIVIGVKNHADSIEGLVRVLMKQHPSSEILIIDYGSTDETKVIVDKLSKDYQNIHIQ